MKKLNSNNKKCAELTPLVSIVIPCYNHAQYVQETIQSVIDQDYNNIELIIIDDGSKDSSVEKIQELIPACKKRFVRFEFRHRPNKGLCATLNEAMEWCEGEYFAPLASDDMALPHKTSTQVDFFLTNNDDTVAGVFGRVSLLHEGAAREEVQPSSAAVVTTFDFKTIFLRKSKLAAPTAMLRLSKLKLTGGYDENVKIEDLYLWLKLTFDGDKLAFIDDLLCLYRRHPANTSQNANMMITGVEEVLRFYSSDENYKESLARSYLVHAGDLAENKAGGSFRYILKGLKLHLPVVLSKVFIVYFYRALLGLKRKN